MGAWLMNCCSGNLLVWLSQIGSPFEITPWKVRIALHLGLYEMFVVA